MAKMIGFHHGALADSYEVQANRQGYTFGENAEHLQALGEAAVLLWIEDCLTDSQYHKVLEKIQKQLVKAAKIKTEDAYAGKSET